jgi:hypothetical protein
MKAGTYNLSLLLQDELRTQILVKVYQAIGSIELKQDRFDSNRDGNLALFYAPELT